MFCLVPAVTSVPDCDWYCPDCLKGDDDFGFEDGRDHSLHDFHAFADEFKKNYYKAKFEREAGKALSEKELAVKMATLGESDMEKEFWRLAADVYQHVEVEYGADVHSGPSGGGFPSLAKYPRDPIAKSGWNLNNISTWPGSLLRYMDSDISGMMVPWLYIGMCFSTFCWHTEDQYTYSINYMHFGDTKTWYGVSSFDADAFEAAMRAEMPELFKAQPNLLFHITTMLSPERLRAHGVPIYTTNQRAGEFVVTFPRSYHAGFNQGFNFAEAVNFAPFDWLPFGRESVLLYQKFNKMPVFSHDELLFKVFNQDKSIKAATHLIPEFEAMFERESEIRQKLQEQYPQMKIAHGRKFPKTPQCQTCNVFLYLSYFSCPCSPGSFACFEHMADVSWHHFYSYSIS
jgi:histone demethylase JARID1